MGRVAGKIALITGGSRGIGAASAKLLAAEGAKVIITDVLDQEGHSLAETIGARYEHLDVSSEAEWKKLFEKLLSEFGAIDILLNNAGIMGHRENLGPQDPEHVRLDAWQYIHKVNLDGVFLGCKYAIALMKKAGGSIINMSSRSGMVGIPDAAAYASSKAAIRNHSKTVALYCAQQGYHIRCNAIMPAAILTPIWDPMLGEERDVREQAMAKVAGGIPLGKMGEPLDVAYAVLYLASDEAKYVTGIELVIDGGILAGSSATPQNRR